LSYLFQLVGDIVAYLKSTLLIVSLPVSLQRVSNTIVWLDSGSLTVSPSCFPLGSTWPHLLLKEQFADKLTHVQVVGHVIGNWIVPRPDRAAALVSQLVGASQ